MKYAIKFIFLPLLLVNGLFASNDNLLKNINLHGDVRTKWRSEWGGIDAHGFKTETAMWCDYFTDKSWVSVKMNAATFNGKDSRIWLEKAFLGWRFYESEKMTLGIEIDRNKMESMFDSKMQFNSNFNGAHLIYSFNQIGLFDFVVHGGPHIVNTANNHYAWIGEAVFSHIAACPLTLKYSFTEWNSPVVKVNGHPVFDPDYHFTISQITMSYEVLETLVYGAYLLNHQHRNNNDGFYIGFTLGKIKKTGDFSFDVCFHSAKSQCVSDIDFKGFRKGAQLKASYALADSLLLESKFTLYDDYSGLDNNRRIEFQAVYSW